MNAPLADDLRTLRSLVRDDDRAELRALLGERVRFDEPLGPFTSWKIGGPADALVQLENSEELAAVLRLVARRALPHFVLGSGSNVLIGDGGVRGFVLRLGGAFTRIEARAEGAQVLMCAGGSAAMPQLVAQGASLGARGIDGLAGIPGSVGGSLRMNAGTDRELGEFVRAVTVQTPSRPQPSAVSPQYFYRGTSLAREAIVADVELAFERGDPAEVRARTQARLVRRKESQPLALPNAGSCFRNPAGDWAARLIEACGAKGWREGDAEVSPQHANFIVNRGAARASDVATLLARVRRAVAEQSGVELELEVHLVGVFA
ncbi:MAG: UDP-N-acetylmuramate dehydrogenase [Vulcanimicrobiaceae bacterium]